MSEDHTEPVTFVDNRKIDPETGEVRDGEGVPEPLAGTGTAPQPGSVDEGALEDAEIVDPQDSRSAELAERTADLQRLQAEYANYRRRVERDRKAVIDSAKASVVTELLAVIDDLERARAHGDLETGPLKAVAEKLAGLLTKQGVTEFGAEGESFDPTLHEAVQHEGEGRDPVLGTVLRKGYRIGERVLRHALVTVTDSTGDATAPSAGSDSIDVNSDSGAHAEFDQS